MQSAERTDYGTARGTARDAARDAARYAARYAARFVRAGAVKAAGGGPSGVAIAPAALENAAGLFEDCAVFVDHAAGCANQSLERLAGRTVHAAYNPAEQAIEGEIELYDTPAARLAQQIIAAVLDHPGPDVGLSIAFYPTWQYNDQTGERVVTAINRVESVDLVFQPAADGRVLRTLGSETLAEGGQPARLPFNLIQQGETMDMQTQKTTHLPAPAADPVQAAAQPASLPAPQPAPQAQPWVEAISAAGAELLLNASGLPAHARQRLAALGCATPAELAAAIDAERAYLAALHENQVVQIGGQPPRAAPLVNGMRTSLDRVNLALEALIAGAPAPAGVAPLTGIRELYHLLSGDYEMTGLFQPERVQLASVNSSTMANMVANALNKRVATEFQNYPMWWQPIVVEEDFQSLQAIKWTILGGVGELPTVAEGAAYTELAWDDSAESGTFVKKGGYLGLTLESIDKDETGRLRGAPRALAQAAWLTLSKAVAGIFTQESGVGPTLSDGKALFHADHGNLGSTALSVSAWNAARAAMRKQTELNSGERLGALTTPKYLLAPPDLEITALQALSSESDYAYTLLNGQAAPANPNAQGNTFDERLSAARKRVIVVDLWTDAGDWAAVADPRMYPTIGVGYRYGRSPEVFSVASPTAGLMFTHDTMPIKARFFFAVAPIDYRGLYKANVSVG